MTLNVPPAKFLSTLYSVPHSLLEAVIGLIALLKLVNIQPLAYLFCLVNIGVGVKQQIDFKKYIDLSISLLVVKGRTMITSWS